MAPPPPAPLADRPDHELAAAAQAGEADAWEELVRRWHPPLLRFLTAQTGDSEAAADLAQDALLAAWRQFARFDPTRPFAPWLYGIARHALLPWWRRRRLIRFASLEALAERADAALATPR